MSHQDWSCLHHNEEVQFFCIDEHECTERKLCGLCYYETHSQIPKRKIIQVEELQKQIKEKLIQYHKSQPCDLETCIKQFQDQISQIFLNIISSTEELLCHFDKVDKTIFAIKEKLEISSFLSLTESEKDIMIKIIRDNLLEERLSKNQQVRIAFKECTNQLDKFTTKPCQEIIQEKISIQFKRVMGLRQGDQYFCFQDGTKRLAGKFNLDKEEGKWMVYQGQNYGCHFHLLTGQIQKKQIFFSLKYLKNGKEIRLSIQPNQPGFDQIYIESFGNKQQIKFLGKRRQGKRIGLWQYVLDGNIIGGGKFNQQGQKIGQWIECHEQYFNRCQIVYSGEYKNDLRFGQWITLYKDNRIGGGCYNDQGIKEGQWIDLHENFWDYCQVVFSGVYKGGVRYGEWITLNKENLICIGQYDEKGLKQGVWLDLHDNFWDCCQVVYSGEYKNGLRFGEWITLYKSIKIGGGCYDQFGLKQGEWKDLHEQFQDGCQVVFFGTYKNDQRFGFWEYIYKNDRIGYGFYDAGVKQNNWKELHENFSDLCQVSFLGNYKNGLRCGDWIIKYTNSNNKIWGGKYNEKGEKSGEWTDLHENFQERCQVIHCGEYRNGLRYGEWNSYYLNNKIGGGNYDSKGRKTGKWMDVHDDFWDYCQVIYSGEYRKDLRIGKWIIYDESNLIGDGNYDEKGAKTGVWTDLHENFYYCKAVQQGQYKNDLRFGQWITFYENNKIAYGNYDDEGLKQGYWNDLHSDFSEQKQIIQTGVYIKGLRQGQWMTLYLNQQIGGGSYQQNGAKTGKWTDPHENFSDQNQVVFSGEYINGQRFGKWFENNLQNSITKLFKCYD